MHVAVRSVAFKCSGARKIVSAVGLYLSQSIHYLIVFNLDYLLTMTHCNQTDQHTITLHAHPLPNRATSSSLQSFLCVIN